MRRLSIKGSLVSLFLAATVFLASTYLLSMLLGLLLVFHTKEGLRATQIMMGGFTLYVFFSTEVYLPFRVALGSLFLALWLVFALCLLAAWLGPKEGFLRVLRSFLRAPRGILNNFLFALPLSTSMLLLAVTGLQAFQESLGVPTGGFEIPNPFHALASYSYAVLGEEVGFRLTPLGAAALANILLQARRRVQAMTPLKRLKLVAATLLYPAYGKRLAGLEGRGGLLGGLTAPEWLVILLSSVSFGLAHLLSGAGWGVGKVSTTFILGVAFSLAYFLYGAMAPILMHWYFNYYWSVYELGAETFPNELGVLLNLIQESTRYLGIAGFLASLWYIVKKSNLRSSLRSIRASLQWA